MLTLNSSIAFNEAVLVQELGEEFVFLNLENEEYYGLDNSGSIMWSSLKEFGSLQLVYNNLLSRFDVEPDILKQDFLDLVEKWIQHGLVTVIRS